MLLISALLCYVNGHNIFWPMYKDSTEFTNHNHNAQGHKQQSQLINKLATKYMKILKMIIRNKASIHINAPLEKNIFCSQSISELRMYPDLFPYKFIQSHFCINLLFFYFAQSSNYPFLNLFELLY